MNKPLLAALALGPGLAAAQGFTPANEYFIGVDGRTTIPTGTYAGLANPNFGRLTLLYGHQYDGSNPAQPASSSHYHAKSVFTYTGPASSPTVVNTTSNFLPETAGARLGLVAGSGAFDGKFVSGGTPGIDFANLTVRPASWLNRPGATEWEVATYNSGGTAPVGRWTGSIAAANLVYEVVGLTSGLSILGADGATIADATGETFALGTGDFAATPIFAGLAPETDYAAQLRIRDLTGTFGDSGVFEYRFRSAAPVPEPATMAALGLGALALLRRRRRA